MEMEFLIDDPQIEKQFQEILKKVSLQKNGETVALMKKRGINYKVNWGTSIISLRNIAKQYEPNHLLALKLWNKQWRESMIMAAMLDVPEEVSEEQMDFWTKTIDTTEIADQMVLSLWSKSKFAFAKSLEWCRGKKHLVRYTGLHLMGRLAKTEKDTIDEMFEPFFDVLPPLAKDPQLQQVFYRSFILLGMKSKNLNQQCINFCQLLLESDSENAKLLGQVLLEELESEFTQDLIK